MASITMRQNDGQSSSRARNRVPLRTRKHIQQELMDLIPASKMDTLIMRGNIDRIKSQQLMANFCPACYIAAKSVLPFVNSNWGSTTFIWTLKKLCIEFKIFDDYICKGTIDVFRKEFLGIVRSVKPDPRSVCHMIVSECYPEWDIFDRFNWTTISLPPKIINNDFTFPTEKVPTLKVITFDHVIHVRCLMLFAFVDFTVIVSPHLARVRISSTFSVLRPFSYLRPFLYFAPPTLLRRKLYFDQYSSTNKKSRFSKRSKYRGRSREVQVQKMSNCF